MKEFSTTFCMISAFSSPHAVRYTVLAESRVAIPMVSEQGGMVSLVFSLASISSREMLPIRMMRVIDWMLDPGSLAAMFPERPMPIRAMSKPPNDLMRCS